MLIYLDQAYESIRRENDDVLTLADLNQAVMSGAVEPGAAQVDDGVFNDDGSVADYVVNGHGV